MSSSEVDLSVRVIDYCAFIRCIFGTIAQYGILIYFINKIFCNHSHKKNNSSIMLIFSLIVFIAYALLDTVQLYMMILLIWVYKEHGSNDLIRVNHISPFAFGIAYAMLIVIYTFRMDKLVIGSNRCTIYSLYSVAVFMSVSIYIGSIMTIINTDYRSYTDTTAGIVLVITQSIFIIIMIIYFRKMRKVLRLRMVQLNDDTERDNNKIVSQQTIHDIIRFAACILITIVSDLLFIIIAFLFARILGFGGTDRHLSSMGILISGFNFIANCLSLLYWYESKLFYSCCPCCHNCLIKCCMNKSIKQYQFSTKDKREFEAYKELLIGQPIQTGKDEPVKMDVLTPTKDEDANEEP